MILMMNRICGNNTAEQFLLAAAGATFTPSGTSKIISSRHGSFGFVVMACCVANWCVSAM